MAKQSQKSEQITQSMTLVYDYDHTMRKRADFEEIHSNLLFFNFRLKTVYEVCKRCFKIYEKRLKGCK